MFVGQLACPFDKLRVPSLPRDEHGLGARKRAGLLVRYFENAPMLAGYDLAFSSRTGKIGRRSRFELTCSSSSATM